MTKVESTLAALDKWRSGKNSAGGYDITLAEIRAIVDRNHSEIYDVGCDMFITGFIRGLRCAKAAQKRKRVK